MSCQVASPASYSSCWLGGWPLGLAAAPRRIGASSCTPPASHNVTYRPLVISCGGILALQPGTSDTVPQAEFLLATSVARFTIGALKVLCAG